MAESLHLREAHDGDLPFLLALYCDVRGPEVAAWGWPASQRDAFLRMQFDAQRRSYQSAFPQAVHHIVLRDGEPVGRRLVARASNGLLLVDMALLATHRNLGLGTQLMRKLMDECAAECRSLHLHVLRGNPAMRLYRRLGFNETSTGDLYIQMEWTPGAAPSP